MTWSVNAVYVSARKLFGASSSSALLTDGFFCGSVSVVKLKASLSTSVKAVSNNCFRQKIFILEDRGSDKSMGVYMRMCLCASSSNNSTALAIRPSWPQSHSDDLMSCDHLTQMRETERKEKENLGRMEEWTLSWFFFYWNCIVTLVHVFLVMSLNYNSRVTVIWRLQW